METSCGIIKLKPNCLNIVKEWAKVMNDQKSEALETLRNEGVYLESVFLTKIENDDYLVYYMRAKNMEYAREVAKNSIMNIDIIHNKFKKDCWDKVINTKNILDLDINL